MQHHRPISQTQWKKPHPKESISYDIIDMKFKNEQNQSEVLS